MDLSPHDNNRNIGLRHNADSHYSEPVLRPPGGEKKRLNWRSRTVRYSVFVILVGSALLMSAVSLFLARQNLNPEGKHVDTQKYQAIFLTNTRDATLESSVYFGKITGLNNRFVVLRDVFYIQNSSSDSQGQSSQLKLIKLGGELHAPEDKMVINRDQVLFWENLKDSGQVVSKIKEYKANPAAAEQSSIQTQQGTTGQQDSTKKSQ